MSDNLIDDCGAHEYLIWIRNRIANHYKETDSEIISKLDNLIYNYRLIPTTLDSAVINKICARYWSNFCDNEHHDLLDYIFERDNHDSQKESIKSFVIGMLSDLLQQKQEKGVEPSTFRLET